MTSPHAKNYKNKGKDLDDLRRRRNEVTIELRKNKRDEALLKKRNVEIALEDENAEQHVVEPKFSIKDLKSIVAAALSPNLEDKLAAVKATRKLLSTDKNPPIDEIIAAGIMPVLVDALKVAQVPDLQFEAAWALTNIASGTSSQTRKVMEEGAVPLFIQLLYSSNESVSEQSVWALGNIIGDGAELRDYVLSHGLVESLLRLFESNSSSMTFMRNLTWVIVNICRNKNPPPAIEVIRQILPALFYLLKHITDNMILIDTIWTLSYITDHGSDQIQLVIESGILQYVIPLLNHDESKIQAPALRVIGNIAAGSDDQTQVVLDLNALAFVPKLLDHGKDRIKKEALWFISNITAGRSEQIQQLIDKSIIPSVINYLHRGSFMLQREAAWAIYNITLNGNRSQVRYLVENNAIEPICQLLVVNDTQMTHILLDALLRMFAHYKLDCRTIADEIERCGGLDTIEALQSNANEEIYKLAFEIIDRYFESSNDEVTDLIPQANSHAFHFNGSTSDNQQFHDLLENDFWNECQTEYFDELLQNIDQNLVDWVIDNQYSVTCFSCHKNHFTLHPSVERSQVICNKCGFNFSVEFFLSSEHFHSRFAQIIDLHSVQCMSCHVPKFELNSLLLPNNIKVTCNHCNFSQMYF